ncbi:MAG: virulence protein [Lachnospiraceae bacterium]|nr:virulence protein [Eubacterium sp.]MCH4032085.1 virulence protein [Lachnospiraceae bacterium]MCH4109037.1 virulence protein [Lachnospiraceae bacterium]
MKANYSMTGTERRDLVHAIERITGEKAEYQFVPTCAYEIGNITVDKEGTLICEDEEKLGRVMVGLGQMGYYPDAEHPADPEPTEVPEMKEAAEPETDSEATPTDEQDAETEPATEPETDSETTDPAEPKEPAENTEKAPELTISLPLVAANVGTLTNILSSKGNLIRHALGVTDIRINVTEDKIEFPWFTREVTAEEAKTYTLFISLLCKLSKELKHASSRPVETDNEKYAFRCFLLRLGFIGPDYKEARKILLQNLTGSAAFRNGAPAKTEEQKEAAE